MMGWVCAHHLCLFVLRRPLSPSSVGCVSRWCDGTPYWPCPVSTPSARHAGSSTAPCSSRTAWEWVSPSHENENHSARTFYAIYKSWSLSVHVCVCWCTCLSHTHTFKVTVTQSLQSRITMLKRVVFQASYRRHA